MRIERVSLSFSLWTLRSESRKPRRIAAITFWTVSDCVSVGSKVNDEFALPVHTSIIREYTAILNLLWRKRFAGLSMR